MYNIAVCDHCNEKRFPLTQRKLFNVYLSTISGYNGSQPIHAHNISNSDVANSCNQGIIDNCNICIIYYSYATAAINEQTIE